MWVDEDYSVCAHSLITMLMTNVSSVKRNSIKKQNEKCENDCDTQTQKA